MEVTHDYILQVKRGQKWVRWESGLYTMRDALRAFREESKVCPDEKFRLAKATHTETLTVIL